MENNLRHGWVECSLGEILTAKKGKKPSSVITEPKVGYVPYILIDADCKSNYDGKLADIAPTILTLMGVSIPEEMTGNVLIW